MGARSAAGPKTTDNDTELFHALEHPSYIFGDTSHPGALIGAHWENTRPHTFIP